MTNLIRLIIWEFTVQNKVNNLAKYLFGFFLFGTLSVVLINNQVDIRKFGIIFSVIYLPLSLIGFSNFIFKQDLDDGSLDLLFTTFSPIEIVLAKFLSVCVCITLSSIFNFPIIFFAFDVSLLMLINLGISIFLLLILSTALLILIGAIQSYFRSNTNFLSILIMPLLIPSIVITGLLLQETGNPHLILILVGIDLILVPLSIFLSSYLLKNIYNI